MRLKIHNLAKIRKAEIDIKGLTVICGLNNTGKSTVGKALHAVFNSLEDITAEVDQQRKDEASRIAMQYIMMNGAKESPHERNWGRKIQATIEQAFTVDYMNGPDELVPILLSAWGITAEQATEADRATAEQAVKAIKDVFRHPDELVEKTIVASYFSRLFGDQVSSIHTPGETASVELDFPQGTVRMDFEGNRCTRLEHPVQILNRSTYIDNPFVIDRLYESVNGVRPTEEELVKKLRDYTFKKNAAETAYRRSMVEPVLEEIGQHFNNVLLGRLVSGNGEPTLQLHGGGQPLQLKNLSLGVKSFLVLHMLLQSLQLQEKDVLVLDEPEIHLHTEWQVLYAEIIVLLQKHFALNVVVTTHSPFFLDALDLYSRVHGTAANATYYLSKAEGDYAVIDNVTGSLHEIYDKITPALAKLKELRLEQELQTDEP